MDAGAAASADLGDDQAELQAALWRAEQRFQALVASVREVVFEIDRNGRWAYLNPAWSRLLGHSVEESLGENYTARMHADDRPASLARLDALLAGEKDDCRAVFRMHHCDGSLRFTEIAARPLRDRSGAVTGLTGTLTDVTERVAAEQQLERERRRLTTVIEGTGVGLWERDERTGAGWFSAEWARMLGYTVAEMNSTVTAFVDLVHPDDLVIHDCEAAKIYSGEAEFFEVQMRMRHKLGHWVWVRSRGRVMEWGPDGQAVVIAGTHTEITDQVAAEQAMHNAQKMEALGRIAGGIAHDFNNLLGVILGSAELIEPGPPGSPESGRTAHAVEVIRTATERATALTDRLLDIAQERTGSVIVVDLNEAVDDSIAMIAKALPESIELVREASGSALPVEVDVGALSDSLLNLAINARDAMPSGGSLTIRTELRPGHRAAADRVAVVVSDTGIGMPAEVQQRIFEPFFTTKPQGEGTGLGLALAYAFVRQSHGDISVSSRPGGGTAFVLEFPRSARPLSKLATTSTVEPVEGRGETVLVVDDEGLLRELARVLLESAGYQVVLAADGSSALATIDSRPDIDLVFSDVVMPGGVSGFDLAAAIRARYPDGRVVLTSGHTDAAPVGFEGTVLPKPYTRAELLAAVRTALDA